MRYLKEVIEREEEDLAVTPNPNPPLWYQPTLWE